MTLYSWNVHRIEHVGNVLSKGGAKKLGNIYVESEFDLTNLKKYISRKKIFWVSSWRVDFYCVDRDRHVDCVYYSVVQCVICHMKHDKRLKSVKEDSFTKLVKGWCLRIQSLSRKLNEVRVMQKSRVRIFQAGSSKAKNKIGVSEEGWRSWGCKWVWLSKEGGEYVSRGS